LVWSLPELAEASLDLKPPTNLLKPPTNLLFISTCSIHHKSPTMPHIKGANNDAGCSRMKSVSEISKASLMDHNFNHHCWWHACTIADVAKKAQKSKINKRKEI
jgi:hypothetical protein